MTGKPAASFFLAMVCIASGTVGIAGADVPSVSSPATQSAVAQTPQQIFTERGLTWMGFWLIVPAEPQIHESAKSLRGAKSRIGSDGPARREAEAAMEKGRLALDGMEADYKLTNDRLIATIERGKKIDKSDVTAYNNWVLLNNELQAEVESIGLGINKQIRDLQDLRNREEAIEDTRSTYINLALDAGTQAESAAAAYAALAKDATLAAAIAQYNQTARPRARLGPSGLFAGDLAFIRQCAKDAASSPVPVTMNNGGDPAVQVVLNGKMTDTMIWDSGASIVTLSSATGHALGLRLRDEDPSVIMTVAGGEKITAKLVVLNSIRLAGFTVKNVECVVLPPDYTGSPDLLGDTFQRHFVSRLNQAQGRLELTPLDPAMTRSDGADAQSNKN